MALTFRQNKGTTLTIQELDDNFRHFTGSHSVDGTVTFQGVSIKENPSDDREDGVSLNKTDLTDLKAGNFKNGVTVTGSISVQNGTETVSLTNDDIVKLKDGQFPIDSSKNLPGNRGGASRYLITDQIMSYQDLNKGDTSIQLGQLGRINVLAGGNTYLMINNTTNTVRIGNASNLSSITFNAATASFGRSQVNFDYSNVVHPSDRNSQAPHISVRGSNSQTITGTDDTNDPFIEWYTGFYSQFNFYPRWSGFQMTFNSGGLIRAGLDPFNNEEYPAYTFKPRENTYWDGPDSPLEYAFDPGKNPASASASPFTVGGNTVIPDVPGYVDFIDPPPGYYVRLSFNPGENVGGNLGQRYTQTNSEGNLGFISQHNGNRGFADYSNPDHILITHPCPCSEFEISASFQIPWSASWQQIVRGPGTGNQLKIWLFHGYTQDHPSGSEYSSYIPGQGYDMWAYENTNEPNPYVLTLNEDAFPDVDWNDENSYKNYMFTGSLTGSWRLSNLASGEMLQLRAEGGTGGYGVSLAPSALHPAKFELGDFRTGSGGGPCQIIDRTTTTASLVIERGGTIMHNGSWLSIGSIFGNTIEECLNNPTLDPFGNRIELSTYNCAVIGSMNFMSGRGSLAVGYNNQIRSPQCPRPSIYNMTTDAFAHGFRNFVWAKYAHAGGLENQAWGVASSARGAHTHAKGTYSHTEGYFTSASLTARAAHAEGFFTLVSGYGAHAEGYYTTASGLYSHAEGWHSYATGSTSHAEGTLTTAEGSSSHAEGYSTHAKGPNSHTEGVGTMTSVLATASHAEGYYTTATGKYAHSSGEFTLASGRSSFTSGVNTTASGDFSFAEGSGSMATSNSSHAEGFLTKATNIGAHAEGSVTLASGPFSHAEGSFSTASGATSHAEGFYAHASGPSSHAEGNRTLASGPRSHAEGDSTIASGTTAHAEGYKTTASGFYSHAEGSRTKATGNSAHAEGRDNVASGQFSHAGGEGTLASGLSSFTAGNFTTASGNYSFAIGSGSRATGDSSQAIGKDTLATGVAALAQGFATTASGATSHAEGFMTKATAASSHAEGFSTVASGQQSHAEGNTTKASNSYSHAEGGDTLASGVGAHAEGKTATASGNYSHAEGRTSQATGEYSHAEGSETIASGIASHAEGFYTIADTSYQHVQGKFNATGSGASMVIGNGTSISDRNNLVEFHASKLIFDVNAFPTSSVSLSAGQFYRTGSNLDEIRIKL